MPTQKPDGNYKSLGALKKQIGISMRAQPVFETDYYWGAELSKLYCFARGSSVSVIQRWSERSGGNAGYVTATHFRHVGDMDAQAWDDLEFRLEPQARSNWASHDAIIKAANPRHQACMERARLNA